MNAGIGDEDRPERPCHEVYVVVGLGPVGLLTLAAVTLLLTRRRVLVVTSKPTGDARSAMVFAVDSVKVRRDAAAKLGAVPLDPTSADTPAVVRYGLYCVAMCVVCLRLNVDSVGMLEQGGEWWLRCHCGS
jgi:hypothetical protein